MTGPSAAGTLTRLTLATPWRRVDLVLPAETPLGELLPEIVRILGFPTPPTPESYRLSLVDGQVVELTESLRSSAIPDGALVRVDRVSDAPMPSVVHDVTEEVADDLERRPGRWSDGTRRWVATAVIAVTTAWAGYLAVAAIPPVALLVAGLVLVAAGTGAALAGVRAVGTAVLAAGASVGAMSVPFLLEGWPQRWSAWTLIVAVLVLAAGMANSRFRASATGAGVLFGMLLLWVVPLVSGLDVVGTATVAGIVSTVLLGLLPRFALVTSGLTRLDDVRAGEQPVARTSVRAALDSAHRGLALAVVFTAASAALAGWHLAHAANGWAIALACLLGITTFARVRACPLTVEVISLVTAALVVVGGLVRHWSLVSPSQWWGGVLVALALSGAGLLALAYRPAAHTRARARQVVDRVEGVAVVAMVPVAVGVFGLYQDLLQLF
ncbi:hypothetical protein GCM10027271_46430 [Saccharopolyspora gloriosae]|uniref:Type VII secretion integral membrane protein EccD n=1 Tax=Saccharopolyspora gloriosae TaxID=455344 RepID=A0A840NP82_9PSEU|nr:type VII secretion integral membrane protein EccD [Saccharopolyspora gloriosae]